MTAETSPPSAPDPDDKSDEQSSSLPLWLVVLAVLALGGALGIILYWGHVGKPWWEGDGDKKFWDYLELLIVPAAIAIGVAVVTAMQNARQRQTEARQRERERTAEQDRREREREAQAVQRKRELDVENQRAQDAALQAYLDQMSQLLLDKDRPLRESKEGDEARTLARARTLTMLPRLDGVRKRSVVQFLYETGLINKHAPVMLLDGADLSGANLSEANLLEVSLSLANLRKADLNDAFLVESDLRGAQLQGASLGRSNLYGADLSLFTRTQETATLRADKFLHTDLSNADLTRASMSGADLSEAFLSEANLSEADLSKANLNQALLREANLSEADLSKADLMVARLQGADLSGAKLSDANLRGAQLQGADLSGADLSGANLAVWHVEVPTDLRGAKGWTKEQFSAATSFSGATMPDGQRLNDEYYLDGNPEGRPTFEEWLKSKDSGEDGENSSPS